MPSITFNNTMLSGKWNIVPAIKGAVFTVSQYARMTRNTANDLYGYSVAATATEMAVGAVGPSSPTTAGAGAVYLYTRNGDDWTDLVTIAGPSNNKIGSAVDISSEWLAVSGVASTATVYLYRKVNGTWGTTPFQTITTTDSGASFGYSLSLSGTSLAIGHRDSNGGNGSVQIWVFDGATWSKQATIVAPSGSLVAGGNGQRVGFAVSLVGNTLAIGAPGATAGTGIGIALIATRTNTTWNTPVVLSPTGYSGVSTGFGSSITINNGNVIIGAANQSAVYVFKGSGSTWTQDARMDVGPTGTIVDNTSGLASARVGWSLTTTPDGSVIVVGGYAYNPGSNAANGVAFVFENVDGTWGPSAISNGGISRLVPTPLATNQRFGWSMAMSGNQLLIGGTGNGSTVAGAVFTFK